MQDNNRVNYKDLSRLVFEVFKRYGMTEEHAQLTAKTLVDADLRGVHSHGVMRLPIYIKRIKEKSVIPNQEWSMEEKRENIAIIDAKHGFGQPVTFEAANWAVKKGKKFGIASVGIKNSHHFGAASFYSEWIAEQGLIGMVFSNTTPLMPAIGGAENVVGNNPFSISVPGGKYGSIVLDMATSTVAMGKILHASKNNQSIPQEWGYDEEGNKTTNPDDVLKSNMLAPVGGPKGFGLAVIVDVLSGVLINGSFGSEVKSIYKDIDEPNACGHFILVLDVESFLPFSHFEKQMEKYINEIKASEKSPGIKEIYMPGEIENKNKNTYKQTGIPITTTILRELNGLANEVNIDIDEYIKG